MGLQNIDGRALWTSHLGPLPVSCLPPAWCPLPTPTQILKAFLQILGCWSSPHLPWAAKVPGPAPQATVLLQRSLSL